jgi:cytochrome c551/c552
VPFTATFTAKSKDPENDPLTYTWDLGTGEKVVTNEPKLSYTFNEIGDYDIHVEVSDPGKLSTKSTIVSVYAGNIAPEVQISVKGNQTFYFPGIPVQYEVKVSDPDDADAGNDLSTLFVSADYISGLDQAEASKGHLIMTEAMIGKSLISSLTCKTCHKEDEASIGPAYVEVARKYRRNPDAASYLINKIQKGGGGVWGETAMPANPDLKNDDASKVVSYILSLGRRTEEKPSLAAAGSVDPTVGKALSENGVFVLSASFTDKGGENIKPLTGNSSVTLRNSTLSTSEARNLEGYSTMSFGGRTFLLIPSEEASFSIPNVDLTDIGTIVLSGGGQSLSINGYNVEFRLGSPNGTKIGEGTFKVGGQGPGGMMFGVSPISIQQVTDSKLIDLYVVTKPIAGEEETAALLSIEFKRK